MKKILTALSAALIGMGVLAAPAQADGVDVCDYLDAHPNVYGVEDLIAMGLMGNGMSPEQLGAFLFNEVNTYCPRHLLTLRAAVHSNQTERV